MNIKRNTTKPKDHAHWLAMRAENINSTEVAALFGLSPYTTLFELWHRKKTGDIVAIEENERMIWGNRLESAIAHGVAEDNKWSVKPLKEYMCLPDHKIGSSFDFAIGDDGILEIKNVDSLVFKNSWIENEDGTIDAPHNIETQVQTQLLVSGRKFAYIAALVGGNTVKLIHREPDLGIQTAIIKKAQAFWDSIEKNQEPAPDFERDFETIKMLYGHAESGKVIESTSRIDELAAQYKELSEQKKNIDTKLDGVKAELLTLAGNAEKVTGSNYTLSLSQVGETQVSYVRKAYRNMRFFYRKEK
jgi:putative phage-type endonuclease